MHERYYVDVSVQIHDVQARIKLSVSYGGYFRDGYMGVVALSEQNPSKEPQNTPLIFTHECGFYFDASNGGGKAFVCQSILSSLDIDTETWKCQLKLKETVEAAFLFQPHVVVTVDSKGFSFRLLKQLRGNMHQLLEVLIVNWMLLIQ